MIESGDSPTKAVRAAFFIVPPAGSCGVASDGMQGKGDMKCCTKELEKEKVLSTILKKG